MNYVSWALNAFKKSNEKGVVPGSSSYIVEETVSNLRTTKDAKEQIQQSIGETIPGFNGIVDGLNHSLSYEGIHSLIQLAQPPTDALIEDSQRSISSVFPAERDQSESSSKPELLLQEGEKMETSSMPLKSEHLLEDLSFEAPTSPGHLSSIALDAQEMELQASAESTKEHVPTHETLPMSDMHEEAEVKMEHISHDNSPSLDAAANSGSTSRTVRVTAAKDSNKLSNTSDTKVQKHASEGSRDADPTHENVTSAAAYINSGHTKANELSWQDPTSLSPIHVINGRIAHSTSPAANLSFIPISRNTFDNNYSDPSIKQPPAAEADDDDDDTDNSFHAISTAIRKSFAGKTSMGNQHPQQSSRRYAPERLDVPLASRNKTGHTSLNPAFTGTDDSSSKTETVKVKLEKDHSIPKTSHDSGLTKSKSRSLSPPLHTGLVFVGLPNKEPVQVHQKGLAEESHSNKQTDIASLHAKINSNSERKYHHQISSSTESVLWKTEARDEVVGLSGLGKKDESLKITDPMQISSSGYSSFKPTRASKPKNPHVPRNLDKEHINRAAGKRISRTTTAGSPVRRGTTGRPASPARSPLNFQNGGLSSRMRPISSVNSSRSPTKYGHISGSSARGTPTNFSIHQAPDLRPEKAQENPHLVFPSASRPFKEKKGLNSNEDFFKNRFSATALLPENNRRLRKSAYHDNTRPQKPGAVLEVHAESLHNREYRNDLSHVRASGVKQTPDSNGRMAEKAGHRPFGDKNLLSPQKKEVSSRLHIPVKIEKEPHMGLSEIQAIPKKRAIGNAIPLPDAARGKFSRTSTSKATREPGVGARKFPKTIGDVQPPVSSRDLLMSTSPEILPEIPSDDEALRENALVKSWAGTPKILKAIDEQSSLDPREVFGECPLNVDMVEVFQSVKRRQQMTAQIASKTKM